MSLRLQFRNLTLAASLCCVLGFIPAATAADVVEQQVASLGAALAELDADPALANAAALERFKARQAVDALRNARSRDREHAFFVAQARVEAARDAAQAEGLFQQSAQLDRERDQILMEASRRDAEMARREADLLRLQSLAREEEAERMAQVQVEADQQSAAEVGAANAQASQAMALAEAREREAALARKEAELAAAVAEDAGAPATSGGLPPSRTSGKRTVYTLAGTAFPSGSAALSADAQASLRRLAAAVKSRRSVRVEAHTDSQGADAANLSLSQKRADAVRALLVSGGVPAARVTAAGKGESAPLADNTTSTGRARNRRVEVSVE